MFDFFELETPDGDWVAVAGTMDGDVLHVAELVALDGDDRRTLTGAERAVWVGRHRRWLITEIREAQRSDWEDGVLASQLL